MSTPDFDAMSKAEVIEWFQHTSDLRPLVSSMSAATEEVTPPPSGVPMVLSSIRLPVDLVERVDRLANAQGSRRSDVIRDALTEYVARHTGAIRRDEAEHALEVLRRLVAERDPGRAA